MSKATPSTSSAESGFLNRKTVDLIFRMSRSFLPLHYAILVRMSLSFFFGGGGGVDLYMPFQNNREKYQTAIFILDDRLLGARLVFDAIHGVLVSQKTIASNNRGRGPITLCHYGSLKSL